MNFIVNIFVNLLGFVAVYFIGLFSLESAFMVALFVAIFAFKKIDSIESSYLKNMLYECVIALFCASILNVNEWGKFAINMTLALIFIRIYDYFKPSYIGRFYNFKTQDIESKSILNNKNFYLVISAMLNGVLSAISTLLVLKICEKLNLNIYVV